MNMCQNPDCEKPAATGPNRTGKFCSNSCSAKVNNAKRRKVVYCLNCDSQVKERHMKFCDRKCWQQYQTENRISQWINGEWNGSDKNGELSSTVRNHLLLASGGKCTECDWSVPNPVTGKVILTIDHIDGNWQNNHRDNLVVLCYNCHTLTPTFGSLNKGKGVAPRSVGSRRH